jgi:hypothetical protein
MYRRKFWDGEVGLSPYVAALRQAISEHEEAAEFAGGADIALKL